MRAAFFLKEAIRALQRNAAPSLAATVTVLVTALVLGIFIPIVQATTGTANEVRDRVLVDIYVANSATDSEVARLEEELAATPNVERVEFISKEEALEKEREENPEAYDLLGRNPLPDLFRLYPDDPDQVTAIADRLNSQNLAAVDDVRNREDETEKILEATGFVKALTAMLAALLVFASIALVANTIRLSIFARRREVEVMKLVGATNWFIRWPFVIEGMIVGAMGGILAVLLLTIAKETFVDPLSDRFALIAAPDTIDFPLLIVLLLISCMAVSALGSGVTLRRFLRI
jgi:cell division transport system permease protein